MLELAVIKQNLRWCPSSPTTASSQCHQPFDPKPTFCFAFPRHTRKRFIISFFPLHGTPPFVFSCFASYHSRLHPHNGVDPISINQSCFSLNYQTALLNILLLSDLLMGSLQNQLTYSPILLKSGVRIIEFNIELSNQSSETRIQMQVRSIG